MSAHKLWPTLEAPIVIADWWKNKRGDASIRIRLNTHDVDIRNWYRAGDGTMKQGSGFVCTFNNLPRLVAELKKAADKARELGLLDEATP